MNTNTISNGKMAVIAFVVLRDSGVMASHRAKAGLALRAFAA